MVRAANLPSAAGGGRGHAGRAAACLLDPPAAAAAAGLLRPGAVGALPAGLGLEQQVRIFRQFGGPVIDSGEILREPQPALEALCDALAIPFDASMLSWPPGPRPTDGVWAKLVRRGVAVHWFRPERREGCRGAAARAGAPGGARHAVLRGALQPPPAHSLTARGLRGPAGAAAAYAGRVKEPSWSSIARMSSANQASAIFPARMV